jgi:hypothetical protein
MPWRLGQLLPFFVFTACTDKEQSISARFYPFSSHHHRTFTFRTWATLLQCHDSSMFRIHRRVNYNPNIYFSMSGSAHREIIDNLRGFRGRFSKKQGATHDETTTGQPSIHQPQEQREADPAHEED